MKRLLWIVAVIPFFVNHAAKWRKHQKNQMIDELIQAAGKGKIGSLIQMIRSGVDVNSQDGRGLTPLESAILADRYHCVRILIRAGADIHRKTRFGCTPLALAVDTSIDGTIQTGGVPGDEPTDVIKLLLKCGADPEPGLRTARAYKAKEIEKFLLAFIAGEVG